MSNQFTPATVRFERSYIPEPNSGCWLWIGWARSITATCRDMRPYFQVSGKRTLAYRFAYELYRGPIPSGLMVCHSCDVSLCVNPDHLFVGTNSDNQQDSLRKGRHASQLHRSSYQERARYLGVRNIWTANRVGIGKTTLEQRVTIYAAVESGESLRSIGQRFGVTPQAISMLYKRHLKRRAALAAGGE